MSLAPPRPNSSVRRGSKNKTSRPSSAASNTSFGSSRFSSKPPAKALQAWGDKENFSTPKSVKSSLFQHVNQNVDLFEDNGLGKDFGWSAAHQACSQGDLGQLKLMAKRGALQQKCQAGNSLLHVGARSGQLEVVQFLLSNRQVDVNVQNKNGWTPLMWTAITGQVELAELLIQAASDIYKRDEKGMTALMWAAKHGHQEIARLLLNAGEHTGRKDFAGRLASDHAQQHAAMLALLEATARVNQRMLVAAQRNDLKKVAKCLGEGAQVNHVDDEGHSALLWAAVHGSVTMMQLLFKFGASTRVLESCAVDLDNTIHQHRRVVDVLQAADGANARLLHSASLADWTGVRRALEQCAFVNTRDDINHRTALSWAASYGAVDIIHTLVKQKAEVGSMDAGGWRPFHFAVSGGHIEATALLHHFSAALDVTTFEGDTPLHMAVQADDACLAQMLLASSAKVDEPVSGMQLTQVATLRGCAAALHTLLMYKADPKVLDGRRTLLHLAATKGHGPVIQLLIKALPPLKKLRAENLLEAKMKKLLDEQVDTASVAESAGSDGSEDAASISSKQSSNSRPWSGSRSSPKAKIQQKRRSTKKVKKSIRSGFQVTTAEALASGHLLMLLKARKMREVLAAGPTAFPVQALNQVDGQTVLGLAISSGHSHLVKQLVSLSADVNVADSRGLSPLMLASSIGDLPAVTTIIEAGGSLTQKNGAGLRALDLASTNAVRAALMSATVRKIAGLPRPHSAAYLRPINKDARRRSSVIEHHRFRLFDLPETLGTADLLEGHIRSLLRRVGIPKPDVLDIPVDPIRHRARGMAYLEYKDIAAADKAEHMFSEAKDQKGPAGTHTTLVREGVVLRPAPAAPRGAAAR